MARRLIDLGYPEDKVKVHHLGVDVEHIEFRPRQWDIGEPLKVLIAASFWEKKGILYARTHGPSLRWPTLTMQISNPTSGIV